MLRRLYRFRDYENIDCYIAFSRIAISVSLPVRLASQQQADPNFDAKVANPAYTSTHPKVLFDEAHNNFHTASGRYKPFVDLITNDGYQVSSNSEKFLASVLQGHDVLVLGSHAILEGRNEAERVNRVMSFTGQSLKGPAASVALLKLSDKAYDVLDLNNPQKASVVSAAGRSQAIAMTFGKGRVVVFGEAAMLSAQNVNFGMNYPGIDNRQLVLNLMHWLTELIK